MNDAIIKAQQFVNAVRRSGLNVTSASVFGSWAKGNATEDSDIDVCVVSPNFGIDYVKEIVDLRKISLTIDSRIEPIPLSLQDIMDPYASLVLEIRKHSIDLK